MSKTKIISYLKFFLGNAIVLFILLELVFCGWAYLGNLKIELPVYSFENTQTFWYDLNPSFGTCHLPNHTFRQKKTCFDVTYTSNQHGFRDRERLKEGTAKRVVFLGDSFIEGVGVETSHRLSNLLEQNSEIAHLNFGMAGNFGTTQYWQVYQSLASHFSHEALLIGILPSNDFIEDDFSIGEKGMSNRYRPYLVGSYPDFELIYHQKQIQQSALRANKESRLKKILKNFTFSYNGLRHFKTLLQQQIAPKQKMLKYEELPGYFNYTPTQLNRIKYALSAIKEIANNKPILVFTIPNFQDIEAYRKLGKNPLAKELSAFCQQLDIQYLDLLPFTDELEVETLEKQFLPCDGHWSIAGNAFAFDIIYKHFDYYK